MQKEKDSYRDNLDLLREAFPDKNLLSAVDVAKWAGRDRRVVSKYYFSGKRFISIAELARKIS